MNNYLYIINDKPGLKLFCLHFASQVSHRRNLYLTFEIVT